MVDIQHDVSLRPYNTFGIEARASRFVEITTPYHLQALLDAGEKDILVLGGGSNILLAGDPDRLVVKNSIAGKAIVEVAGDDVLVAAGAGENWHGLVEWAIDNGLGGLENLSLIPGTVGAAPIQNIGAYGVELSEVFDHLEAIALDDGRIHRFDREACQFGYRDSIFKGKMKGQFVIVKVVLRLSRKNHRLNTNYGSLDVQLREMGCLQPSIRDVSRAVMAIRTSKLPDPAVIGNAGSFFKNPQVSAEVYRRLQRQYPAMPAYRQSDGTVKIPAGWLIEQCGWKGYRDGDAGCYEKQALVLVNYGNATGADILALAESITGSVAVAFGIRLEREVNVVGG